MAQTTVRVVADVTPQVATLLATIAAGEAVSKRTVLERAIEKYAELVGYAKREGSK
jgi:hypothetical protein